jgi:hypothetical protein
MQRPASSFFQQAKRGVDSEGNEGSLRARVVLIAAPSAHGQRASVVATVATCAESVVGGWSRDGEARCRQSSNAFEAAMLASGSGIGEGRDGEWLCVRCLLSKVKMQDGLQEREERREGGGEWAAEASQRSGQANTKTHLRGQLL